MPLVSVDDYKAICRITGSSVDAAITLALSNAESRVVNYCGRTFAGGTYTERLDGTGTQAIVVTEPPIASVESLQLVDGGGDVIYTYEASGYVVDPDGYTIRLVDYSPYGLSAHNVLRGNDRTGHGPNPAFPRGWSNVKVVYDGGYATTPPDLAGAIVQLASVYLGAAADGGLMQSEGLGAVSYSRGDVSASEQRIFSTIRHYRRSGL